MASLISRARTALHAPIDPRTIAVLRIGLGLSALLRFGMLFPWLPMWYGPHGVLTRDAAQQIFGGWGWGLLWYLPDTMGSVWALWLVAMTASLALLVGFRARIASAILFVVWVSFLQRNRAIWDAGDTLFRIELFLAVFMPLGARFSFDAWRGRAESSEVSGIAVRLLRLQVVFALLIAGIAKLRGAMWRDGTAMSKVMFLDDFFGNLWMPDALRYMPWVWYAISWGTLLVEHVVPVTVWIPKLRRISFIVAIAFHLGLLWTMNIFHFQLCMIIGWLSFLHYQDDAQWLATCVLRVRARLGLAS